VYVRLWTDSLFYGRTTRLIAVATGADSAAVAWPAFAWTSSDTSVAAVDSTGRVLAKMTGSAWVVAEFGGNRDSALVRVVPQRVDDGTAYITASVGEGHCALTNTGLAHCLTTTLGDSVPSLEPLPGATGLALTALSVSDSHRCGLDGDGTMHCWGSNSFGQFLNGTRVPLAATTGSVGGSGGRFGALAAGSAFTCAARSADAVVLCAGENRSAQLGRLPLQMDTLVAPVSGNFAARAIAGRDVHTCAIDLDGAAWCWGINVSGASGLGSGATPRRMSATGRFASISVGTNHSCALSVDATAWCWGNNTSGQLGLNENDNLPHSTPDPVFTDRRFASIAAGNAYTCGVSLTDELMCWGAVPPVAVSSRLGPFRGVPRFMAPEQRFRAVTLDDTRVCGLTIEGRILCF
jgi:hypothetical protein